MKFRELLNTRIIEEEESMINEFDFELRLRKIGDRKSARPKPFVRQLLDVACKSGFKTQRKSSFTV
jgi:hypothetical protein